MASKILTLLMAGLAAVTAMIVSSPVAHAVGSFDNASIADRALAVPVGTNGGECWIFVQNMILRAGGPNISNQAGGNDYFAHLRNAGATPISDINALGKGDVVQQGRFGGHTYIIIGRVGGSTFDVVDSNRNYDRRVSRYSRNVTLNADTQGFRFGRVSSTPNNRQPFGHLDEVRPVPGGLNVAGWGIDPDTDAPIEMHFYAGDGTPRPGVNPGLALLANSSRPDVANAFPPHSPNHGVTGHFKLPAGSHTLCAYGIDSAGGHNPQFGCRSVTVPDPEAGKVLGALDGVDVKADGIEINGWAADRDYGFALQVRITGLARDTTVTANSYRPDVHAVHPGFGVNHGLHVVLPHAGPGDRTVCVTAINGPGTQGSDVRLGCRTVTVPHPPAPTIAQAKAPPNFRVNANCGVDDCVLTWHQPDLRGGELLHYRVGGSVEGRSLPEQQVRVPAARVPASQVNSCKPVYFWIYAVTSNPANGKQMDGAGALTPSDGKCPKVSTDPIVKRPSVTATPVAPSEEPQLIEQGQSTKPEHPEPVRKGPDQKYEG